MSLPRPLETSHRRAWNRRRTAGNPGPATATPPKEGFSRDRGGSSKLFQRALALTEANWHIIMSQGIAMKARVDRFGRIVVPKEIRDNHGLVPGSGVEIEDAGETIVLRRSDDLPGLVEKDGILVFRARATGDLDEAIRAFRDERLRSVRGPAR